ncbi:DUF456 domain-containing protein [Alkalibacter rhizosphaerae]|uniref:DUF456 domain-containing protein n=1 Tax=Alkalibacter rhizosphaerae TaxID=2815577 RepID=A0A975AHQ7_9FIRM|nr:DUF456 domain-containing protein [Alkalibacter rhizosphaerae]QSX07869.1 DUF456 domain-containing protein [Alkalibacter rhizosphaerae]
MNIWALIAAILLFITGIAGTVLPMLPGPVFIFGGMLFYGIVTDFISLDSNFFLLQAVALVILFLVDYVSSAVGTKFFGGTKRTAVAAAIGTVVGLVVFGPIGLAIGPFLGSVLTELINGNTTDRAIRIGFGALIGLLGGTLLKIVIELIMIGAFFMKILF